jgi:hypothetical protein
MEIYFKHSTYKNSDGNADKVSVSWSRQILRTLNKRGTRQLLLTGELFYARRIRKRKKIE